MTTWKAFGLTLILSGVVIAAMYATGTADPMLVATPAWT